jgi:large subunit ribosomal protein L37Ae
MTKTKIVGSSGRFGVRYGISVRRKIADIESKQRQKQFCIFCKGKSKRVSKGIWLCNRCGKKFAGHAFFLEKEVGAEEAFEQMKKDNQEKNKALKKENPSIEKKEKPIKKIRAKKSKDIKE